ncbi:MAG: radical SAM family heme chaperone HemW [Bryobacteraceae bacterium]|nr:radical SAM family heme chaperone HemW [Bryobacteraceae bacterium]MDW8377252.1 radical SAM family heme chaperone HemW [Bryobacterales bacterium]
MAGVYVSYPFCAQKCSYCNFASGVFTAQLEARYLQALAQELRQFSWPWKPETIYLGGGTPSRMEPAELRQLLACIPGYPWQEATLEAAPGDVTPARAEAWVQSGINRISLGVQSFEARELSQTGRRHSAQTVQTEVSVLRAAGIQNFNIDLIAGLPHQTLDSFTRSLDWVERLEAPHVSVYMLEVDEESRLGRELIQQGMRYGASAVPDEAAIVAMYELAVERLADMGLRRYEISNFARPGFESKHNLKYWRLEPYAGFGADAHSFDGRERRQNVESAAEYVAAWEKGAPVTIHRVAADLVQERLLVGLRLSSGVPLQPAERERYAAPLARFLEQGFVEERDGLLCLTNLGVLYSNEVFQELLP